MSAERLTIQAVRQMLQEGESQWVEFKGTLTNASTAARDVAAMANSGGGNIIVGVDAEGNPLGLSPKSRARVRDLVARVGELILPEAGEATTWLRFDEYQLDGGIVLVVRVRDIPEQYKPIRTVDGIVYQRRGDHVVKVATSSPNATASVAQRELKIFVAMSFQVDREPALVDYYYAMKRAIQRSGIRYRIDRVDEVYGDYEVTAKIEEMITSADVVIADFTLNSPNVYYEAGIARGSKVYTIRTARKDTDIPFDVGTKKFILYANATQLEESLIEPLQRASEDLRNGDTGVR
ncbi:AlbA family DNA-binding domain-containing protein [Streptomyces chartreusis]